MIIDDAKIEMYKYAHLNHLISKYETIDTVITKLYKLEKCHCSISLVGKFGEDDPIANISLSPIDGCIESLYDLAEIQLKKVENDILILLEGE